MAAAGVRLRKRQELSQKSLALIFANVWLPYPFSATIAANSHKLNWRADVGETFVNFHLNKFSHSCLRW